MLAYTRAAGVAVDR